MPSTSTIKKCRARDAAYEVCDPEACGFVRDFCNTKHGAITNGNSMVDETTLKNWYLH